MEKKKNDRPTCWNVSANKKGKEEDDDDEEGDEGRK